MGRYKSMLMAEKDARAFPYHVDIPVPPMGLGKQLDLMEDWLRQTLGAEWRHHGSGGGRNHVARFMFRSRMDAELFEAACKAGMFSAKEQS